MRFFEAKLIIKPPTLHVFVATLAPNLYIDLAREEALNLGRARVEAEEGSKKEGRDFLVVAELRLPNDWVLKGVRALCWNKAPPRRISSPKYRPVLVFLFSRD